MSTRKTRDKKERDDELLLHQQQLQQQQLHQQQQQLQQHLQQQQLQQQHHLQQHQQQHQQQIPLPMPIGHQHPAHMMMPMSLNNMGHMPVLPDGTLLGNPMNMTQHIVQEEEEEDRTKGKRGRKKLAHAPREHTREGKWSVAEKEQLENVVRRVLDSSGYTVYEEGLRILLDRKGKLPENLKGAWRKIYDAMGDRKEKSVYHCAYRLLTAKMSNPTHNHKWTIDEEERLKTLVDQYGKCWSKCGFVLNRPPWACRDKWRLIKEDYSQGTWKAEEDARLMELVKPYLCEGGGKHAIDWGQISQQLGTRSHISCRRRWVSVHAQLVVEDGDGRVRFTREDDAAIIDWVYHSGATDLADVKFNEFPSKYLHPLVANRFNTLMKKELPDYRSMPFRTVVQQLQDLYSDVSPEAIQRSINQVKDSRAEQDRALYHRLDTMHQGGMPGNMSGTGMVNTNMLSNGVMPNVMPMSQPMGVAMSGASMSSGAPVDLTGMDVSVMGQQMGQQLTSDQLAQHVLYTMPGQQQMSNILMQP
jgi:hypothetical protein